MLTYESQSLTPKQMSTFKRWLDKNIGTEYEQTDDMLTVFDLTSKEADKVKEYEKELTVK